MKKLILLAIVFSGLTTSCFKKDRTCECTDTSTNGKITVTTATILKSSKTDAKIACSNLSSTITLNNTTSTEKSVCVLK